MRLFKRRKYLDLTYQSPDVESIIKKNKKLRKKKLLGKFKKLTKKL